MTPQEFNTADLIILVVVGLSTVHALFRGLVRSVLSLATLAAAVVVVWLYAGSFAGSMAGVIESGVLRNVAAFLLLFTGVMLLGNWLLAGLLTGIVSLAGLTLVDRALGGVFGALRGVLVVCLALYLLQLFFLEADFWVQSLLIPVGMSIIDWLATVFPQSRALVGI